MKASFVVEAPSEASKAKLATREPEATGEETTTKVDPRRSMPVSHSELIFM
jgi:hypothetical protein